jgi:hypothetical protein
VIENPLEFIKNTIVELLSKLIGKLFNWFKKAFYKITEVLGFSPERAKTAFVRLEEKVRQLAKYFSRNKITNEWEERVVYKTIDEDDVPEELREIVRNAKIGVEVDSTSLFLQH